MRNGKQLHARPRTSASSAPHQPLHGVDRALRVVDQHLRARRCRQAPASCVRRAPRSGTSLSAIRARDDFGPVRSMNATRLFVVPRSMPTTGSGFRAPKSIWKYVQTSAARVRFPPVEPGFDVLRRLSMPRSLGRDAPVPLRVVTREQTSAMSASIFARIARNRVPRGCRVAAHGIVAVAQLFQRHVQFENLFQQFRRHAPLTLFPMSNPAASTRTRPAAPDRAARDKRRSESADASSACSRSVGAARAMKRSG